jgi:hypothetical protein
VPPFNTGSPAQILVDVGAVAQLLVVVGSGVMVKVPVFGL